MTIFSPNRFAFAHSSHRLLFHNPLPFPTLHHPSQLNNSEEESEVQPAHNRRAPDVPPALDDRLPLEPNTHVKHQMPDTIKRVEGERPGGQELGGALDGDRQRAERRRQRRALEVPAHQRGRQVSRREDVQRAAEAGAREALPDGTAEEGLLLVVDLEVRGHGAVEALLGQEGVGVGGGEFLSGDGPVIWGVSSGGSASFEGCERKLDSAVRDGLRAEMETDLVWVVDSGWASPNLATLDVKKAFGLAAVGIFEVSIRSLPAPFIPLSVSRMTGN